MNRGSGKSGSALKLGDISLWACSSVGRAPALQAGGQGFESPHVHQISADCKELIRFALHYMSHYSCTLRTNCAQSSSLDRIRAQWSGH
jgi:hypothetical protein